MITTTESLVVTEVVATAVLAAKEKSYEYMITRMIVTKSFSLVKVEVVVSAAVVVAGVVVVITIPVVVNYRQID